MSNILQQIAEACVPVLCLLITAGGAYLVALLRKRTNQIKQELDNDTAAKYIGMAENAVAQAVACTAQTFVEALKKEGAFTKEKQLAAFNEAKDKVVNILGETAVAALREIYGDFDLWIETKIEENCLIIKNAKKDTAETAAVTAASVATTIATTAVQQLAAEAVVQNDK